MAMAELHVQRKRNHFSWFWALLIIILVAAGIYLYLHYKNPAVYPVSNKSTGMTHSGKTKTGKIIQS